MLGKHSYSNITLVHPQDPISAIEDQLTAALDELESTGVSQHSNQMSILDLLNPVDEVHSLVTTTDEDIFNTVMEARQIQEGDKSIQDDLDEDLLVDPIPTCDEQHRCMGWYSHGISKVSVKNAAGVKQVRAVMKCLAEQLRELIDWEKGKLLTWQSSWENCSTRAYKLHYLYMSMLLFYTWDNRWLETKEHLHREQ